MLKRDRTPDEKYIDKLTKRGMLALGVDPAVKPKPRPFPYVLFWSKYERKGQRCKVVASNRSNALVEFEDGFRTRVNRRAIRQAEG